MNDPSLEKETPSVSRGQWVFLGLVALVLAMRIAVLVGSQQWLNWDECIIGLTAQDVLRGHFHLYFLSQSYGGGAGLETLAIALFYLVFGVTAMAVKSYALLVSMATLVVLGLFVRRVWGWSAANWAVALWATAPSLAVFSLQVRAGYIEIQLFSVLVLYFFFLAAFQERSRLRHFFGLGLAAGLAYYSFGLSLPLLVAVGLVILALDKFCWLRPRWWLALAGLLIALAPMIYHDLTHGFAHVKWALSQGEGPPLDLARLGRFVSFELPGFFQHHIDDWFETVPWFAWILGGLTVVLTLTWVVGARRDLAVTARQLVRRWSTPMPWPAGLETCMIVFLAIYTVLYLRGTPMAPRYFLGLYPVLAIGMAVGVSALVRRSPAWPGRIAQGAASLLVAGGLLVNVHLMNLPGARAVLGSPTLREASIQVVPGGILPVRDWLLAHGIHHVFAHPVIKWKLIFYSNEKILGLSAFNTYTDDGKMVRYMQAFDEGMMKGAPCAFVFHRDFAFQGPDGGWVAVQGRLRVPGPTQRAAMAVLRKNLRPEDERAPPILVPYRTFFFRSLEAARIRWKIQNVGDYQIIHGFEGGSPIHALRSLLYWER